MAAHLETAGVGGNKPLAAATLNYHVDIVQFLLSRGANVQVTNMNGWTTLTFACMRRNLEIVRLLLDANIDVEARDDAGQQTALHYAAQYGHSEILRELILEHNANMFAQNHTGKTPLID